MMVSAAVFVVFSGGDFPKFVVLSLLGLLLALVFRDQTPTASCRGLVCCRG